MRPNNKIINPRGLRTGGVPPYSETRQYVARGGMIYAEITRKPISPATAFDESSLYRPANATLVNTDRRNSFYFSDTTRNASSEHAARTTRPNRNTSNLRLLIARVSYDRKEDQRGTLAGLLSCSGHARQVSQFVTKCDTL